MDERYVTSAYASGSEIVAILDRMDDVFEGEPTEHCIMACITAALLMQKPEMDEKELQNHVLDVSKYIVMLLGGADETTEKEKRRMH